jgi:WhiB family redox-sensing transcriptional regulator
MNKPRIGTAVTVGLEAGIVEDITVNNGNTLYIVQTDTRRVAVTEAGLERSNALLSDRELNKIDRAADSRKPLAHALLLAIKPDRDPIWYDAACNGDPDPEAWWLDHNIDDIDVPRLGRALTMCSKCPVREQCLQVGLSDSEINTGIWGGMLPGERIIARYGAPRRTRVQRVKMETAAKVRQRVELWLHQQLRKEFTIWSSR